MMWSGSDDVGTLSKKKSKIATDITFGPTITNISTFCFQSQKLTFQQNKQFLLYQKFRINTLNHNWHHMKVQNQHTKQNFVSAVRLSNSRSKCFYDNRQLNKFRFKPTLNIIYEFRKLNSVLKSTFTTKNCPRKTNVTSPCP